MGVEHHHVCEMAQRAGNSDTSERLSSNQVAFWDSAPPLTAAERPAPSPAGAGGPAPQLAGAGGPVPPPTGAGCPAPPPIGAGSPVPVQDCAQ